MNNDCIFCRIVQGELPSRRVWENEAVLAFHDIHPQAPVHILIVPKTHLASLSASTDSDEALLGRLMSAARIVAEQAGLAQRGYKVIVNDGPNGGQVVPHLHLHVLGGQNVAGVT